MGQEHYTIIVNGGGLPQEVPLLDIEKLGTGWNKGVGEASRNSEGSGTSPGDANARDFTLKIMPKAKIQRSSVSSVTSRHGNCDSRVRIPF
jgi:hypothetical protein